jgi:UDP-N-acetylglucosamine acyltransferase
MSVSIDPHAIVGSKAKLGENVCIESFTTIEDDVVIGDGTWVGPHVHIANGARLGRNCKVFSGAVVGGPPQDLKYKGEPTTLEVGNNAVIRECVTLNRATIETGKTVIGNDCLFMAYTHVGHDCRVGNNVIIANCAPLGGHVHLGDYVIIGGLSPVHQFVHIGDHAMVAGGFRVVKDVPPYILCGHEPLCFEGLNIIGLKRRGFSAKSIEMLDKTYRILYRSNLNVSQAVARIKEDVEQVPEVKKVLEFIAGSKRGILPGHPHK